MLALLDTTGAMASWAETGPGPFKASTPSLQAQILSPPVEQDLVGYGWLVQRDGDVFYELFHELATKFVIYVDLLGEISENCRLATDIGVLRLYEKWLRTKSSRNAKQLADHGIIPDPSLDTRFLQ